MEGYRVQRDLLQTQIKLHAGAAGGAGRRLGPRGVLARHGSPGDRASALWDDNVKLGQIASSRALLQTGCLCGRAQAGLCFLARSCSHAATTHGQALQTRPSSECLPLAVVPRSSGLWAAGCLPIAPTPLWVPEHIRGAERRRAWAMLSPAGTRPLGHTGGPQLCVTGSLELPDVTSDILGTLH